MGIGDDLIWLGDARNLHNSTGKTVKPLRRGRAIQIKNLWETEGYISKQGEIELDELVPHGKDWLRPYAVGDKDYMPTPASVTLYHKEMDLIQSLRKDEPYAILCVDTKETTHDVNKTWPKEYYEQLADLLPYKCIRLQHNDDATQYKNIHNIRVESPRESLCYVHAAQLVVTTDGFLHHASASTNTKCAVIWSVTSFAQLGYKGQLNIYDKSHLGCYTYRKRCDKCVEILRKITPETVIKHLYDGGFIQ